MGTLDLDCEAATVEKVGPGCVSDGDTTNEIVELGVRVAGGGTQVAEVTGTPDLGVSFVADLAGPDSAVWSPV